MRNINFFVLIAVLASSVANSGPAYAQRHSGYCDHAESTAAALECVNRHKKDAQDGLSEVYQSLYNTQKEQNPDAAALLGTAQKDWIAYRNAQCSWESALAQSDSLTRIYELSCLTALTELRAKMLSSIKGREESPAPPEFSASPRWMNVVTQDNPEVFWHFGDWVRADLDCDGESENIMTGLRLTETVRGTQSENGKVNTAESSREAEINKLYSPEVVIAVAENPVTGKPKVALLSAPVRPRTGQDMTFCAPHLTMAVANLPVPEKKAAPGTESPEAGAGTQCKAGIQLSDMICKPVHLYWTGEDYALKLIASENN